MSRCTAFLILLGLFASLPAFADPPPGYVHTFHGDFGATYPAVPITSQWNLLQSYDINRHYPLEFLAHTPYAGDFGYAWFVTPGDPAGVKNPFWDGWDHLYIDAFYWAGSNHWATGLISTADTQAGGFSQALGYWECSCRFPDPAISGASWPAFWLDDVIDIPYLGLKNSVPHYEIDGFEKRGEQHFHKWLPNNGGSVNNADNYYVFPWFGNYPALPHIIGILITAQTITWSVDGVVTFSIPAPSDIASHKFYAMVDYATTGPFTGEMEIDSIDVYAPPQ